MLTLSGFCSREDRCIDSASGDDSFVAGRNTNDSGNASVSAWGGAAGARISEGLNAFKVCSAAVHPAFVVMLLASVAMLSGCATVPAVQPHEVVAPRPIQGNSGTYMCPYTTDGVLAEWVDKAINARIGAAIGKTAGAFAGRAALRQVPFIGGFLGAKAGEAAGRQIAISASGGWEYIKATSDLSFNNCDDLAVYLFATHSSHDHYQDALKATWEIYPQLQKRYAVAIRQAPRR